MVYAPDCEQRLRAKIPRVLFGCCLRLDGTRSTPAARDLAVVVRRRQQDMPAPAAAAVALIGHGQNEAASAALEAAMSTRRPFCAWHGSHRPRSAMTDSVIARMRTRSPRAA